MNSGQQLLRLAHWRMGLSHVEHLLKDAAASFANSWLSSELRKPRSSHQNKSRNG